MDTLYSPVRYEQLTEIDVQTHIRHSAANLKAGERVEFLLCEAGVIIPMVKHDYRTKPSTLDALIRSGSVTRDHLTTLRESLKSEGYDMRVSFSPKRNQLSRIVVRLPIDGTVSINGLNLLKSISTVLGISWPSAVAVGYYLGSEAAGLPGRLAYRQPLGNVGYELGFAVGRLFKRITS